MRIDDFQNCTENGVSQRLLNLPTGELERPQVIYRPHASSLGTTNRSNAGGSIRDSSVAVPASVGGSEAHRSDGIGIGSKPSLTGSPSSFISDLSVLDGMSEKDSDKSMRPPQEHLVLKKGGRRRPTYISPPTSNSCVFCDLKFQADSGLMSWSNMMDHIRLHHTFGDRLAHARIDWTLVQWLWEKGLLTLAQYRELKPSRHAQDIPSPPGLSEDPIAVVEERRHRGGR